MNLKCISCEVFFRELSYCAALSEHTIDIEFTEKDAHERSPYLRDLIQEKIDATDRGETEYDAILLGFGLCGNSIAGLAARRTKLVVPRAHDCCTLFLGSKERFQEHFRDNPSMPFSSAGYLERGTSFLRESTLDETLGSDETYRKYVEQYGEENAKYLMETLHTSPHQDKVVFIDVPELAHLGYAERCKIQAEAEGRTFVRLEGSLRLFRQLTAGDWNDEDFLIVEPGERIAPTYDWDRVIDARDRTSQDDNS
jgi:hypothetical protein